VHKGQLHLQPISETHQFRPTLTYLDIMSGKSRRSRGNAGSDEDSDDGPPPDPDEPPPVQIASKKEKKPLEVKEVQVSARKAGDDKGNLQGGLSAVRREMLLAIRAEEDEAWEDLDFCDGEVFFSSFFFGWMLIALCRLLKDKKYLKLCFRKMRSI
jgi:DNA-directed RNA polymerase-3 subunit RPC5